MAIEHTPAYDEIFDFLTSSPTPEDILTFRPSEVMQDRMRYLLDANRNGLMSPDERAELDEFIHIVHLIRGIKLRARQK
jgi:hypothetical protein